MIFMNSGGYVAQIKLHCMLSVDNSSAATHVHKRFPERLGFLLYNPIRRRLSPPTRLLSLLRVRPDDVVVDFGCGPGFYAIPLARIATRTIGIDVSTRMLERLRDNCKKDAVKVEMLQSDGTSIDLEDDSIDLILTVHVFHEIEKRTEVLSEFSRILRGSGRLVIVERTKEGGFLSRKVGPPVIDQVRVTDSLAVGGFRMIEVVENGEDSIIIAGKLRE